MQKHSLCSRHWSQDQLEPLFVVKSTDNIDTYLTKGKEKKKTKHLNSLSSVVNVFLILIEVLLVHYACTSKEPVWGSVLTQSPDKAEESGGRVGDSHNLLWPQGGMRKGTLKGNIRQEQKCLLLPVEWNWICLWVLVSLYKYLLRKKNPGKSYYIILASDTFY